MDDEEKQDWMQSHSILARLYQGDVLRISDYDKVGTIKYYDENGNLTLIHTKDKWLCNGQEPNVQYKNNGQVWPLVGCIDTKEIGFGIKLLLLLEQKSLSLINLNFCMDTPIIKVKIFFKVNYQNIILHWLISNINSLN